MLTLQEVKEIRELRVKEQQAYKAAQEVPGNSLGCRQRITPETLKFIVANHNLSVALVNHAEDLLDAAEVVL